MNKTVLKFRKRVGCGGRASGGAAVLSLTSHGKTRSPILCITVRKSTMEQCRWRHGDRVHVDFEPDQSIAVLRIHRTSDAKSGYSLSCSKGEKYGAVIKMTVSYEDVGVIFKDADRSPLICTLINGDANVAELAVQYPEATDGR